MFMSASHALYAVRYNQTEFVFGFTSMQFMQTTFNKANQGELNEVQFCIWHLGGLD